MARDLLADAPAKREPRDLLGDVTHPEFDPSNVPGRGARQPSRIGAFLSSAVEGIPIAGPYLQSGVEHTASAIGSALTGDPREQVLQEMREDVDQSQEAYPYTSLAGSVGGAVLGLSPVAATGAGARALGITGKNLLSRTLASAASGTAIGGADAAVRSDGDLTETAKGAGYGFMAGLAGPAIGDAVGWGARKLIGGAGAPGKGAERRIVEAMQADDLTAAAARQRLQELGPDGMLADLGPNLRADAAAISNSPGPGQKILRDAFEQRAASAPQRIRADANATLGQNVDAVAARQAMVEQRAAQAAPLYQKAYSEPFTMSNAQKNILKAPAGRAAFAKAQRLAQNEGIPLNPEALDVRGLDLVKRALDDQIEAVKRAGKGNEARILTQMKDRFIQDAPGSYKQALDSYSGPSQIIDAMDQGQTLFNRRIPAGQVKADVARMSAGEREAFIQGARSQIEEIMANSANDALTVRKLFREEGNRRKLELVLGKANANKFLAAIHREEAFAETAYTATGNSVTAARQAAQRRWGEGDKGIIETLLNMDFGSAGRKTANALGSRAAARAAEMERATAARLLSGQSLNSLSQLEGLVGRAGRVGDTVGSLSQLGLLISPQLLTNRQ